jgi:hypothetical protein
VGGPVNRSDIACALAPVLEHRQPVSRAAAAKDVLLRGKFVFDGCDDDVPRVDVHAIKTKEHVTADFPSNPFTVSSRTARKLRICLLGVFSASA